MSKHFQCEAQIGKVETLVDGGNKVVIYTQELPWDSMSQLFSLRNKAGHLLFSESQIADADVPTTEVQLDTQYKKPSQRLRAVIYRLWELTTNQKEDFDTVFYPRTMEGIINKLKDKLP